MLGWINLKLESRFLGKISITSDMQRHHLTGRKQKGTEGPLEEGERGERKCWLKLNIQKTKIMASGPITSWQIDGETMKTIIGFISLGSKIMVDGDCSHEIKTLAPWKKSYNKPRQHVKEQRHHFVDKGWYSQSYGFSSNHVWMWELGHKEVWRIDAFELCFWRKCLRVPLTSNRSNQSILKEINPEYSLEELILKLKLQYFGYLIRRADSMGKTLILGKIEGRRRRDDRGWDGWMASLTQWRWVWTNSGRWWRTGNPDMVQSMGSQKVGTWLSTEQHQPFVSRVICKYPLSIYRLLYCSVYGFLCCTKALYLIVPFLILFSLL